MKRRSLIIFARIIRSMRLNSTRNMARIDGEPRSWVEFKQRPARILTDWDSYMISSFKIWRGRSIAESTSLKFYVAIGVEIGDVIHYHQCHITQDVIDNSRIEIGGRSDRGYAGDMEPMFFVPLSHFSEI